ncbi:MAG: transcriptional regulator NrdR [Planctomycetaceae bacterium]|jgi:transcriptional repressor NrdR|nr:transcriptional regulator NrdR [Planctomycetaceae bacterium]
MKCPVCHKDNDRVVDTRTSDDGSVIRRRRECCNCGKRFTTFERAEVTSIQVIKKDGHRMPFDRDKLRRGLEHACWKRPVSADQLTTLIAKVEGDVNSTFYSEVASRFIGERVMSYLRELDQVAYVRFASVYLRFSDARDFAQELDDMMNNPKNKLPIPEKNKEKNKK